MTRRTFLERTLAGAAGVLTDGLQKIFAAAAFTFQLGGSGGQISTFDISLAAR